RADADPQGLASVEALAGDAVLGAFVVVPGHFEAARRRLLDVAPHVRVVAAVATEATLPTWISDLFEPAEGPLSPLGILATALSQPPSLGEVAAPGPQGALSLRGMLFGSGRTEPRLLGGEARRRAHAVRLAEARAEVTSAGATVQAATEAVRAAEEQRQR